MTDKALGEANYEQFASRYAKFAETKPHNAMYERPATMSLLPELDGLRVLDAGCGPGIYAEHLLDAGAQVVAFDVTPAMIDITRARVHERAELHVADLAKPLSFAADQSFDLVICPLALDYVEHWEPVFAEFFRVLRPGGTLVYSHGHPMSDYNLVRTRHDQMADYFKAELFGSQWAGFGKPRPMVHSYRRPLAMMLNPLAKAGFALDKLLEPLPTKELHEANYELFAILSEEPCFVCIRATRPG